MRGGSRSAVRQISDADVSEAGILNEASMMRVAYALTTEGRDIYSESARISIASVRASNPSYEVIVVCDKPSADALRRHDNPILKEANSVRVMDVPSGTAEFRNRLTKTRLRDVVEGRFLYLDADTFVQGDLDALFRFDADVACAANASRDGLSAQRYLPDDELMAQMGWQCRSDVYANGGVLAFNDTEGVRTFFSTWHQKYIASCRTTGNFKDQPSLNSALAEVDMKVALLPHCYNAQFRFTPDASSGAIILHFYASGSYVPTNYDAVVSALLKGRPLPTPRIQWMVRHKAAASRGVFLEGTALRRIAGQVRHRLFPSTTKQDAAG